MIGWQKYRRCCLNESMARLCAFLGRGRSSFTGVSSSPQPARRVRAWKRPRERVWSLFFVFYLCVTTTAELQALHLPLDAGANATPAVAGLVVGVSTAGSLSLSLPAVERSVEAERLDDDDDDSEDDDDDPEADTDDDAEEDDESAGVLDGAGVSRLQQSRRAERVCCVHVLRRSQQETPPPPATTSEQTTNRPSSGTSRGKQTKGKIGELHL